MPRECVHGATLRCTQGLSTSQFVVLPHKCVNIGGPPAGNIMDHVPMVNILPFGLCHSVANPAVAGASGSPQPCIPVTALAWTPGSPDVVLGFAPALNDTSVCQCTWAGTISVVDPGQPSTYVA